MRSPLRRSARRQDRRGATLVLVSLLLVPLVGVAAFSLDVGWWQMGANQLQTTADAAALAAARGLQVYSGVDAQAKAQSYAQQVATVNRAFGQVIALTSPDIEPVVWSPTTRTATATNWGDANAVRVTARANAGRIFSGVFGGSPPGIGRTAIAWVANINGTNCIRPWSLPYDVIYDKVTTLTGIASTASPPGNGRRPDLSQEQLSRLSTGSYSEASRVVVMRGPTTAQAVPAGAAGITSYAGRWEGYNFSGNAGNQSYQSNIYGCDPTQVSVTADQGTTLPGNSDYECWTVRALMGSTANTCNNAGWTTAIGTQNVTCHYKATTSVGGGPATVTTSDAGCYASTGATAPGVTQRVSWGDMIGTGSNAVDHRVVGTVKLICVFRGLSTAAGESGQGTKVEHCSPGGAVAQISNLPRGTLVVAIEGLSSLAINETTELGNVISTNQRLILVR
ncbi:pilus assembly protein TadG-related protein [Roseisolibacter sp. H3M3-2]|uniref:pilus assembly protein TadG-related protein n=1 Tax=Roseisolibacter sp. H3M3-2 TaxID=3031323 RepID=UPI0023DB89B6|nr:pilus assembly protein TadG-related protein [Roseisolibacter sp. H3M3-2]MDF1501867.1 pilus assembly protein TadG-related protein [Roseisolibacter sp. H3M3-2]